MAKGTSSGEMSIVRRPTMRPIWTSEHFQAKWIPLRVKKTRQLNKLERDAGKFTQSAIAFPQNRCPLLLDAL
jgi:hypothetical protein